MDKGLATVSLVHSQSANEPANWATDADLAEYSPLDVNHQDIASAASSIFGYCNPGQRTVKSLRQASLYRLGARSISFGL
jgi:hypothetical protein